MTPAPLVTLIVPTVHHRAALYARTLKYLEAIGWRSPVVVSDHSGEAHAGAIAEAGRRSSLDLQVLRHAPGMHFLERLMACARAARTPYVHLHADDDFVIPATLDDLVERMQADAGCVAAMGVNLHVDFRLGEVTVLPKYALGQRDAFERLVAQLETYSSVLYALRRREEFIDTLAFTVARCPDVQFWQYLESCVAAVRGPVVVTEELHYVRSVHDQKWSATLKRERSPDHFPYLILSDAFPPRLAAFRAALREALPGGGDAGRLDAGVLHLLHRGFPALGFPKKTTASAEAATESAAKAILSRAQNLQDPVGKALQRIFAVAAV